MIFIRSFLFECFLCNHSFKTNPNKVTNLSKLFQLTSAQCVSSFYVTFLRFDRKKDIPKIVSNKKRPQTAQHRHSSSSSIPLARELGLPESDLEWDMALTHQFKTLFFQLKETDRTRVLNDLILHSTPQNYTYVSKLNIKI